MLPFLEKRYGVTHIELACAHLDHAVMQDLGFRGKLLFTYRVTLFPGDEAQTMKNMKSTTRTQLRKAIKLGLTARIESEESFVDEFYNQMKEVFVRRGKTVPFSRNCALRCFRHMKESGNLLALSIRMADGTCIATGIFMIEGKSPSLELDTPNPVPLILSQRTVTMDGNEEGYGAGRMTFDMAGGGEAKVKFGAVPDETGYRWTRSRYRWLAHLRDGAEKAYRWQQALRGRIAQRRTIGAQGQPHNGNEKHNR